MTDYVFLKYDFIIHTGIVSGNSVV